MVYKKNMINLIDQILQTRREIEASDKFHFIALCDIYSYIIVV